MPELHDLLEREAETYAPPRDLWERVRERGRRRERTRRAGSALAGVVVIALAAGGLLRALTPTEPVQFDTTPHPLEDTWVALDWFGASRVMEIRAAGANNYGLSVKQDEAAVCGETGAIMTGTGRLEGGQLVVPALVLECDDGTEPETSQLGDMAQMLRNYTIVYDPATDKLTDKIEVEWIRQSIWVEEAGSHGTGVWPQSDTDEVRRAQRRANAGDPRYTWQVDRALDADRSQGDAEIFARFLTEELGWERFRRNGDENVSALVSEHTSVVGFVRCAVGQANPLYPNDPEGGDCAPTLDEHSYETVDVTAYQPFDSGPKGIWVIVNWHLSLPARQTAPPSDAEVAAVLEAFGQARIDGEGAQEQLRNMDDPSNEIPLLYATSTGAPYERFDYKVVSPPAWPDGRTNVNLRLFATGGKTVVEQQFWMERSPSKWVLSHDRSTPDHTTTTENGLPVPESYNLTLFRDSVQQQFEDGIVTFSVDPSWEDLSASEYFSGLGGQEVMEFSRPGAHITVVVDPLPPAEGCGVGEQAESADVLIRRLRSSRSLSVSEPVPASLGAMDAVRLDVTAADRGACSTPPVLAPRGFEGPPTPLGLGPDEQATVYLLQTPGDPGHTVAVVLTAAGARFEQASATARPIIESFEVNAE